MKTSIAIALTGLFLSTTAFGADEGLKNPNSADDIVNQLKPAEPMKFRGLGGGFRGVVVEMPKAPASETEKVESNPQPSPTPAPAPQPSPQPVQSTVSTTPSKPDPVATPPQNQPAALETVQQPTTQTVPTLNMKITFEFNSSTLTASAKQTLSLLGEALNRDELRPYRFLIAGHTDASGSAAYNQKLSLQRAQSVGHYLTRTHGVATHRLQIVGYGEEQLFRPDAPRHGDNRRVQVTNLGSAN